VAPTKGGRSACGSNGRARRPSAHIQLFNCHRGTPDPNRPFPTWREVPHHRPDPPAWRSLRGEYMQIGPTGLKHIRGRIVWRHRRMPSLRLTQLLGHRSKPVRGMHGSSGFTRADPHHRMQRDVLHRRRLVPMYTEAPRFPRWTAERNGPHPYRCSV
jgi:hypothetical protein